MLPAPGDVLVTKKLARLQHSVAIVPNPPYVEYATHNLAVAKARELASERRVDLWLTEDRIHFKKLASFHPDAERG